MAVSPERIRSISDTLTDLTKRIYELAEEAERLGLFELSVALLDGLSKFDQAWLTLSKLQ